MGTSPHDLKAVFDQAAEIDSAAEREAFLTAACAGSSDFRKQVEALLSALNQAGSFLEKPHPAVSLDDGTGAYVAPAHELSADLVGTVIAGKYKLLQLVGKGGMGAVYMADQLEPVKRRVAVKLISSERGNSKTILSRFEAERQAIALMDHPNIAKLLDAGETPPTYVGGSPSPFFVMELVKGIPLTEYCDEHRLSILDRLNLFTQICSAVQHAHQKGIIHRDLKPTNILVESHDDKPVPRVIDFGLAKATSGMQLSVHTLFTALGTVAGTPLYMAPEQAKFNAIDIDTRADIYALGVILYELLTGTTPIERQTLKQAAFDEILRVVRELEPPTPSKRLSSTESKPTVAANRQTEAGKLGRFVRGELDWIVMKALSKERDRRYETANGFAKDIERFLNHEAVLAGPPSVQYKVRKFVQRNRPQVIAGSLVLLALLVGIAGTTFGLIRAERRRVQAETSEANETAQRTIAEAEKTRAIVFRDKALDALRATTGDDVEKLLGEKKDLGPNERAYLEAIVKRWQVFAEQEGTDEQSRAIRAEGHFRVALLWAKLGRTEEALAQYEASRDLRKLLVEQFAHVPSYELDLANTYHNLGIVFEELGRRQEATTAYQTAREIKKALVNQFPHVPAYQFDLARTHNNIGTLLQNLRKVKESRAEHESARDIQKQLVSQFPGVPVYLEDLAGTHSNLGNVCQILGERENAAAEYRKASFIQKQFVKLFPDVTHYQSQLATTQHNLGVLLDSLGQHSAAEAEIQLSGDIWKKLAKLFPLMPKYQQHLAASHNSMAIVRLKLGKREEAREEYAAARDVQKKLVEQFPKEPHYQGQLAIIHKNLGHLLKALSKPEEAHVEYVAAREILKNLVKQHPEVPAYQIELGALYYNFARRFLQDEGKPAESLEWFTLAIQTSLSIHEKFPFDLTVKETLRNSYWGRARAYEGTKMFAQAVQDWDRAIELSPPVEQPRMHASAVTSRVQAGQVAMAIADVADLTKSSDWNATQWYNFACVYSVASGKIADKKQEYANRAMELLQKAVKAGCKDAAHMAKDTDLDPLRGREDFKKLMGELEAGPKKE